MLRAGVAVAVSAGLLACASASAAPSDPDPSFGRGGLVAVQANRACLPVCVEFGGSYADALALQPDGGIVLGGYNVYMGAPRSGSTNYAPGAVVRLRSNGELDTSFGGAGGILDVPLTVTDLSADALGGLLVTGEAEGGGVDMQRYTAGGVLDTSFGSGGTQLIPRFTNAGTPDRSGQRLEFAKVVVPPTFFDYGTWWLGVKRLLASGQPDRRYGRHGYAVLPDAKEAAPLGMIVQQDGGVIVAFREATASPPGQQGRERPPSASQSLLVRLTPAGKLDGSFGAHGIAELPFQDPGPTLITMHSGHLWIAAGGRTGSTQSLALTKLTKDGHPGTTFGKAGMATMTFPTSERERYLGVSPRAITFDSAGNAIVVGKQSMRTVDTPAGDAFLARFTPHGRDCSFGTDGLLVDERFDAANVVAVQPDGRIVVAGGAGRFVAARYLGAGSPCTCPDEPRASHH